MPSDFACILHLYQRLAAAVTDNSFFTASPGHRSARKFKIRYQTNGFFHTGFSHGVPGLFRIKKEAAHQENHLLTPQPLFYQK